MTHRNATHGVKEYKKKYFLLRMLLLRKGTDSEISKDKFQLLLFISFSLEPAANWLK